MQSPQLGVRQGRQTMNIQDYSGDYTEESLWSKLGSFAVSAGKEVVEKVLVLFEALKDADTPAWAKAVIVAALGYFIAPVDAIPDIVPFAGFADDLGALAVALGTVATHVKKEHIATASQTKTIRYALGSYQVLGAVVGLLFIQTIAIFDQNPQGRIAGVECTG